MAFRFRRTIKIAPGIKFSIGKKSVGVSAGIKGLHVGTNTSKGSYISGGVPGTGVYGVKYLDKNTSQKNKEEKIEVAGFKNMEEMLNKAHIKNANTEGRFLCKKCGADNWAVVKRKVLFLSTNCPYCMVCGSYEFDCLPYLKETNIVDKA